MGPYARTQFAEGVGAKQRRIDKLKDYPVNTKIVWKFGGGNSELVIKHDTKLGRLITRGGGNYDPFEVELHKEK